MRRLSVWCEPSRNVVLVWAVRTLAGTCHWRCDWHYHLLGDLGNAKVGTWTLCPLQLWDQLPENRKRLEWVVSRAVPQNLSSVTVTLRPWTVVIVGQFPSFPFFALLLISWGELAHVRFLFLFLATWNLFFLSHLCALKYLLFTVIVLAYDYLQLLNFPFLLENTCFPFALNREKLFFCCWW